MLWDDTYYELPIENENEGPWYSRGSTAKLTTDTSLLYRELCVPLALFVPHKLLVTGIGATSHCFCSQESQQAKSSIFPLLFHFHISEQLKQRKLPYPTNIRIVRLPFFCSDQNRRAWLECQVLMSKTLTWLFPLLSKYWHSASILLIINNLSLLGKITTFF